MDRILSVSIEDQHRMVTGTPVFLGIVPHPSPLDCKAIQRKHCGIHVQDETGSWFGNRSQFVAQEVVDFRDSFELFGTDTFQKIPQGCFGWETIQSQKSLERAIVRKNPGVRNSFETSDHSINQTQQEFRSLVSVVPPLPGNVALEQTLQIQFSTKLLKKDHTSVVSDGSFLEGNFDFLETFCHLT